MPAFSYPVASDRVTLANAMDSIERARSTFKNLDTGLELILEDFYSFAVSFARYAVKRACFLGSGLRADIEREVQNSMDELLTQCPMTAKELDADDRIQRGLFLALGWVYDERGDSDIAVKYINELYVNVCDEIIREVKKAR